MQRLEHMERPRFAGEAVTAASSAYLLRLRPKLLRLRLLLALSLVVGFVADSQGRAGGGGVRCC